MRRRFTCNYEIGIHNNEIWYTSTDSSIIIPSTTSFGANIVSNTYLGGKGIITFDGDVTEIGSYAFYECTSLKSIIIPESVTEIGNDAFSRCSSLANTTIPIGVVSIGFNAFRDCINLKIINISDSVTTIGDSAFEDCSSLTSVTIPDSVTEIGNCAFEDCSSLKEFKGKFAADGGRCLIIDGVLNAFAIGCGVTQYTIPDSITTIGESAFKDCYSLTSVTIGNSVTDIGNFAFCYCTSLTSVYCKATTPPKLGGTYVFDSNASGRKIYVPMESVNTYKSASGWSVYASYIVGYNF